MKTIKVRGINQCLIVSSRDYDVMSQYDWRYDTSDPEPLTAYNPRTGYESSPISILYVYILGGRDGNVKPRFLNGNTFDCRRENVEFVHWSLVEMNQVSA
jgi:hypothetical protein